MDHDDARLRALTRTIAPDHAALMESARAHLRRRLTAAQEIAYDYGDAVVTSFSPNANGYDAALALRVDAKGVLLYFNHGKDLPDPAKLLQGAGKQVRSLRIDDASTFERSEVAALVEAAITRSPIPYSTDGVASLQLRATAAAKRRSS